MDPNRIGGYRDEDGAQHCKEHDETEFTMAADTARVRKPSLCRVVDVELIALDHEGNPAKNAGYEGGEIAE
jgi:hypothetical protein